MIRSITFLIYVIVVLISSATVRAADVGVRINSAGFDEKTGILSVHGNLPNACTLNPRLKTSLDDRSQALKIQAVAEQKSEVCIQPVGESFDLIVDIDQLYQPMLNSINPKRDLAVDISEIGFRVYIHKVVSKPVHPAHDMSLFGKVVELHGEYFLQTKNEMIKLKTAFIDLKKYEGMKVWAYGFRPEQTVPIVNVRNENIVDAGSDVGIDFGQPENASLLVTGISAVI